MYRRICFWGFLSLLFLGLTGCLSHWFIETESRLQVENATDDIILYGIDVVAENGDDFEKWIDEIILPGERSKVYQGDWVGEFSIRIRHGRAGKDTLQSIEKFKIDGGSLYLKITAEKDSLVCKFK